MVFGCCVQLVLGINRRIWHIVMEARKYDGGQFVIAKIVKINICLAFSSFSAKRQLLNVFLSLN